jgi:hypothetical protein
MIYCLLARQAGRVKIGYTDDPIARIRALQTGCAEELEIVAIVRGDMKQERQLHKQFAGHRAHGEWFHAHQEILDYFNPSRATASGRLRSRREMRTTTSIAHELDVSPGVVIRWITQGILVGSERVYLHGERHGQRWRVWPEDLERFIAAKSSRMPSLPTMREQKATERLAVQMDARTRELHEQAVKACEMVGM